MAVASASKHLSSMLDVDTFVTTASPAAGLEIAWVDMRDSSHILIEVALIATSAGGLTAITILADTDADGQSGNAVEIKSRTDAGVIAVDAVGDFAFIELDVSEISGLEATQDNLRYVSAVVTGDVGDDLAVTYVRKGLHKFDGLTDDFAA